MLQAATLQTISIIVVSLQDNRAVFRIFVAFLIFHLILPRVYIYIYIYIYTHLFMCVCVCVFCT